MSETREDNPKLVLKDIALGKSIEIVLDSAKPVKTGKGEFGDWTLWFATVTNAKVHTGRGAKEKVETGYTGKVILFPPTKLNETLIKTANGKQSVKIKITKTAEESKKGLITRYVVDKLSEGETSEYSLTPTELRLIEEATELKNEGHNVTEDIFIKSSQEPQYEGKISLFRAKELFKKL